MPQHCPDVTDTDDGQWYRTDLDECRSHSGHKGAGSAWRRGEWSDLVSGGRQAVGGEREVVNR